MSGIFGLHVGSCGSQIGHQFWKQVSQEHQVLSQQPIGRLLCFYQTQKKYQANSLFIDMQTQIHLPVWAKKSKIYNQQNTITQQGTSKMLFAEGFYKSGAQLKTKSMQQLKKRVQLLQCRPDFLLSCGISGGTGSGVSSCLLSAVTQQYNSVIHSNIVLPNLKTSHIPDIYNSVLAFQSFIQNSTMCTFFQNKAAEQIVLANGSHIDIKYEDIDKLYGHAMKQITSGFRFPGSLNSSYLKLATSLIPFPRIHFFTQSISSINKNNNNNDPIMQALYPKNFLGLMEGTQAQHYYGMGICCRDPFAYQQEVSKVIPSFILKYTDWIPYSNQITLCDKYNSTNKSSATILVNSATHVSYIKQLSQLFTAAFRRKSFLYHYTSIGMDQMEFTQAQSNLNDLLSEYQPCFGFYDQFSEQQQFPQ